MSKNHRRSHARSAQGHPSAHLPGASPHEPIANRQQRLEQLLLTEIQSIVCDQAVDPALEGIALLRVTLSADAAHARVAYAVIGSLEPEPQAARRTQDALGRATGFVRARLATQLNLKKLPRLSFTLVGVVAPEGVR
jgi:ribosome-binding factor A